MAKAKRQYELMVVVAPPLMEQKQTPKDGVEALIVKVKGEVVELSDLGEKTLAYPLGGYDKGYYLVYKLVMPASSVKEFRQKVGLEKGILRWLLTIKK